MRGGAFAPISGPERTRVCLFLLSHDETSDSNVSQCELLSCSQSHSCDPKTRRDLPRIAPPRRSRLPWQVSFAPRACVQTLESLDD